MKDFALAIASAWTLLLRYVSAKLLPSPPPRVGIIVTFLPILAFGFLIINQSGTTYFPAYFFFFSALTITMFTDTAMLLISQLVTLYLVPVGWILANLQLLPLSPLSSIAGSLCGLLLLWAVRKLSLKFLKKEGLGQGDVDLLCFIGAFVGPFGCWITLMIGSILASLAGITYYIGSRAKGDLLLPFGLFLSMAAMLYVLFQEQLSFLFFPL